MPQNYICSFSNPKPYPGIGVPTLPTHQWNYASSTCVASTTTVPINITSSSTIQATSSISTSTQVLIYPYFTSGEIIITLFLFIICVVMIMQSIAKGLSIFSTKKKYMQYGGGDVEVRDDL